MHSAPVRTDPLAFQDLADGIGDLGVLAGEVGAGKALGPVGVIIGEAAAEVGERLAAVERRARSGHGAGFGRAPAEPIEEERLPARALAGFGDGLEG